MSRSLKERLSTLGPVFRTLLSEMKDDLGRRPLIASVRNVRNGIRYCQPEAVASALLARYQNCYLLHADHGTYPRVEIAEYLALAAHGSVPLVRVKQNAVGRLTQGRENGVVDRIGGVTIALGLKPCPSPTGRNIIADIVTSGQRVLTVDDAQCILDERANTRCGYWTKRGWISDVEEVADRTNIAGSLLSICEQVVSARVAVMVIYTPFLWGYFRLWRRSLRTTMPALLPIE